MDPSLLEAIGSLFGSFGGSSAGASGQQQQRVPAYTGFMGNNVSPSLLDAVGTGGSADDPANAPDDIDVGGGWNPATQSTAIDHAQRFLRLAGMTSSSPLMNAPPPRASASINRHAPPVYGSGHANKIATFGNDMMQFRKQHFGGSYL